MPPQRVLELGSADFDEIFQHAVTMELLTESQLDAFTDDIASGQASELELLSEWAPRVSVVAKDRGNQLFAQKDVQGARDSYELAIRCDSKNRSACCNLALMYLKLNIPDQAALAANTALTLTDKTKPFDSIYWKARYRRGLAFEALGKLEYAMVDLDDASGPLGGSAAADAKRVRNAVLQKRRAEGSTDKNDEEEEGGDDEKGGNEEDNGDEEDDGDDLLEEIIDIRDKRLRRQLSASSFASLPKINDGPFASMSREQQKAQLCNLVSSAMDESDRGNHREALKCGSLACMMSVMLGEAPSTLLTFTILSAAHLGLLNFETAMVYADRAIQILQPYFDVDILTPDDKPRTPNRPQGSKAVDGPPPVDDAVDDGRLVNGLRHPCTAYAPKTVLVCEAFAYLATGMVHSRAMRMAEAIHDYRTAETALRLLLPSSMARGMLATVLTNIGNNLGKNQNHEAAQKAYDEAREVASGGGEQAGGKDTLRDIRLSQALLLHQQGDTAAARKELTSIWATSNWKPDEIASKRQVLLLLTNLSDGREQPEWFGKFDELQQSLGFDPQKACPVCFEDLLGGSGHGAAAGNAAAASAEGPAKSGVVITTCFHALHSSCWQAHKAAQNGGGVACPVCRHDIVVSTSLTAFDPRTQQTVPLRPGKEAEDLRALQR